MIFKHTCLDGEDRLGQETDCLKCRALLLEAFRAPADIPAQPGPRQAAMDRHPSGRLPHPLLPEGSARTVDLSRPEEHVSSMPSPDDPVIHITQYRIRQFPDTPGGTWKVTCSCGWEESGSYARYTDAAPAERLARIKAYNHESGENQ